MHITTEPHERPQRLGRPRLAPDELRTEELRLYLSLAEKQRLDEDAHVAGMRPADYVRRLITGHRPAAIESKSFGNPRLLLELNAIGNNLNQAVRDLHAGSTRHHDWDYLQQLLQAALERVAFGDVR
jgi:hypothetical protein